VQEHQARERELQAKVGGLNATVEALEQRHLRLLQREGSSAPLGPEGGEASYEALQEQLHREHDELAAQKEQAQARQAELHEQMQELQEELHSMAVRLPPGSGGMSTGAGVLGQERVPTERRGTAARPQLEAKLREQLAKKDRLVRALRDAIKLLGAL
jgi:DNA repair exonuclease SbcCD ATPase subunit